MDRQQTIDAAVALAVDIADNNRHGYSQANRWGPDYDCSSMLISVWQAVGVPVKDAGATYTGNMYEAFTQCGFVDVTAGCNLSNCDGMKPGDVLLNHSNHTAMYIGDGELVHARSSEGNSLQGDQSGNEIRTQPFYVYSGGWDCVLRYTGEDAPAAQEPDQLADGTIYATVCLLPELHQGDRGYYVCLLQDLLRFKGFPPENSKKKDGKFDGEFGDETKKALNRFKGKIGLPADGICDPQTFAELINKN